MGQSSSSAGTVQAVLRVMKYSTGGPPTLERHSPAVHFRRSFFGGCRVCTLKAHPCAMPVAQGLCTLHALVVAQGLCMLYALGVAQGLCTLYALGVAGLSIYVSCA